MLCRTKVAEKLQKNCAKVEEKLRNFFFHKKSAKFPSDLDYSVTIKTFTWTKVCLYKKKGRFVGFLIRGAFLGENDIGMDFSEAFSRKR